MNPQMPPMSPQPAPAPAPMQPTGPGQPNPQPQPPTSDDWHPEMDEQQAAQFIEENLSKIDDRQKAFVMELLTPETAILAAILAGDQDVYTALKPYVNPAVMLVPMPRDQAMQMMQQTNSPQAAPGGVPAPSGQQQRPPLPATNVPGSAPSL